MDHDLEPIKKYVRAANYLTAAQIYLKDNYLLKRPLSFDDIKPRLLGHWGTCPGSNFVYAHLNYFVKKHKVSLMYVLGTGHGFPSLQANLFLEGTLQKYYPEASKDEDGISFICKNFSWPYGFPSHSNPTAPGVIVEGGELGYALSSSYGAVLDNPDLVVACLVGDGEAETGPTATAWHLNKFINPAHSGAVLPILHLNGYKISGPTIMGRMSNDDLVSLFTGYGYQPMMVELIDGVDIYKTMAETIERAYDIIRQIQFRARAGETIVAPRFPMIILKTPKGWTGIKELHGEKIEGNNLSHQVVGMEAKTNEEELRAVESWLRSYDFPELFNELDGFHPDLSLIIPESNRRIGDNPHAFPGRVRKSLLLPDAKQFAEDASDPGTVGSSSMRRTGLFLTEVFKMNEENKNFRLMSPDETYSNKLDAIFSATSRQFELPLKEWDKDLSTEGRVMEMLSEHSLQGMLQGYLLTGRHGIFASYEAFVQIVSSMCDQYSKFLKVARETPWRGDVSSLNYILTSSGWRQDHNGFSHQNPGFIGNLIEKGEDFTKVYFPPDGNSTLAVMKHCLASKNGINVVVAGKTLEPRWLTYEQAEQELKDGLMIWDFASDEDPQIVFVGIGDYVTKEVMAAIDILNKEFPAVNILCVNVIDLLAIQQCDFDFYFTPDKPVIINFHGYPDTLKKLLFDRPDTERFHIHGYIENGSTTTPYDMHIRNKTSRWHLVLDAVEVLFLRSQITLEEKERISEELTKKMEEHRAYIIENGIDPDEIENWRWTR